MYSFDSFRVFESAMTAFLLQLIFLLVALLFIQPSQAQLLDHTTSGSYQIRNCNAGQINSKASALQALLPQIYNNLQAVIADAELGNSSHHGFASFFYENKNIPYVQGVFKNIAAGDPLPLAGEGRAINPLLRLGLPTIVCLQPGYQETAGLHTGCIENPNVPAATSGNFVVLCPSFWDLENEPQPYQCPRVRRNTLTPNDDSLVKNRESILIHELLHVYGLNPNSRWQDGDYEEYFVRDATDLDEEDGMKNAANYAYYYAGD